MNWPPFYLRVMPHPNEALLPSAWAKVAAGGLRPPAAFYWGTPQQIAATLESYMHRA